MGRTLVNDSEEKKPIKKKNFSLSDFKEKFKISDEEQKPTTKTTTKSPVVSTVDDEDDDLPF